MPVTRAIVIPKRRDRPIANNPVKQAINGSTILAHLPEQ